MQTRMIALLSDGARLKGFARDFSPGKPGFHLRIVGPEGETGETRELSAEDVQAVFFVRDFAFDREQRYAPEDELGPVQQPPAAGARRIRVRTAWGETLEGLTYGYQPNRPGFFLFPTEPLDRALNLERAWLARRAVVEVEFP